jgi:hypothetical protein
MNVVYKTKSEQRVETSEAIQAFLAKGGSIQVVPAKKQRGRTKQKMATKSSRGFQTGSAGFAVGYPTRSL